MSEDIIRTYRNIFNEDVKITLRRGKIIKLKPLKTKGKMPLAYRVETKI